MPPLYNPIEKDGGTQAKLGDGPPSVGLPKMPNRERPSDRWKLKVIEYFP